MRKANSVKSLVGNKEGSTNIFQVSYYDGASGVYLGPPKSFENYGDLGRIQ